MSDEDVCDLQLVWALSPELAERVDALMARWSQETRIGIEVISGFRTDLEQVQLGREGRPTAPVSVSTHTTCPATGADVRIRGFVTTAMKAQFGRIAVMEGLRWGGGGAVDPTTGIPLDWNHVDLGPRRS